MNEAVVFCEDSLGALVRLGIRFFVYAVLFGLMAMGMLQGAVTFGPEFYSETGPVEVMEAVFALTTALFFLLAARWDPSRQPAVMLLTGFFFCVFIREFDYFLDLLVFRHAWKAGVLLVLILTAAYVWRARTEMCSSICRFVNHPGSGIFLAGILVLLVFSRVFGCGDYWEGLVIDWKWMHVKKLVLEQTCDINYTLLMEDKCLTVKRVVEESTEQIGYFMMVIAAFEYMRDAKQGKRRNEPVQ